MPITSPAGGVTTRVGEAYQMILPTGTMAAGFGTDYLMAARWGSTTHICAVDFVRVMGFQSLATGFTAGVGGFLLFRATAWTASDSGGSAITPSSSGELRPAYPTWRWTDLRVSSTAALTAGTRTLDGNKMGAVQFSVGTGTQTSYGPSTVDLFNCNDFTDGHPLILTQDTGLVMYGQVPATGTWSATISIGWHEIPGTA